MDNYTKFLAGYTHKETYTVEVDCKTAQPVVVKKSTYCKQKYNYNNKVIKWKNT